MEHCEQLLAVLRNDTAAQEWAGACARLKTVFETLPGDAKAALVSGDDCVPALLHAIGRDGIDGDDGANALVGACDALNALITGLPKEAKQALLSGEKGVVDALLRVLADTRGGCAWGSVGFCFRNMFLNVAADVRQQLLSDGRGIVEAIVGVLDGDETAAWEGACGALRAFPVDVSIGVKQSLLSGEKGIVRALLRVLGESKGKAAWGNACFSLGNMIFNLNDDFKKSLLSDGQGVIEAIIGVLDGDETAAWVGAVGALLNYIIGISSCVKQSLLSGEKGIVLALLRVLGESKGKAAWNNACRCFRNMFIGTSADCREALLSDGRGIVEAIVGVLDGDEAAAWAGAGGALNNFLSDLSVSAKQSLLSGEKGILVRILRVLGDSNHGAWGDSCSCMSSLLADLPPSAKSMFLLSQPQLVATIIARLGSEDAHGCWTGAMKLLKRLVYQEASLSHINFCTLRFLNKDCGLMALLLRCSNGFCTEADNKGFHSACSAVVELSLTSNPPLVDVSAEIMTLFVASARLCSYDPALRAFGTLLSNLSENVAYCSVLAQTKCHEYALSKIAGVPATDGVWSDAYSVATRSLSLIINMSRNEALHAELKQADVIQVISRLAAPTSAAELRALMALSYIIGCKESSNPSGIGAISALTQLANSSSIGKIVDCLENTLNLKGGPGYSFGSIVLPAILQALAELSCSDSNKLLMGSVRLIQLLTQSLRMFIDDKPVLNSGGSSAQGGGADIPSARYAVSALAQLSFLHESDASLLTLMPPDLQLPSLLEALAASSKDVGDDARLQARSLAKRLTPKAVDDSVPSPQTPTASQRRKHVMLSYCWADAAKPELVKALGLLLQEQGIDVWRDETGSSLVGPMSDSTDETMALAVEASSVVVICVSQKCPSRVFSLACAAPHYKCRYKVSPNCRQEAAYARQLEKKGRLKLVYVMMQEECVRVAADAAKCLNLQAHRGFIRYTTVSQPDCVDGWLGVQLSDKLWFPCWNSKFVSDSAARIIPLIASQERTAAALQPTTSAASASPTFSSSQALPASPRSAATPTVLPLDRGAGKYASSFATPHSGPAAVDAAPLEKVVASLQARFEELQVENRALASRSAATDNSHRSLGPSVVVSDADAGRLYSVIEALLASQQAMQDKHQSSLQTLQESLISNQRSLQEALAASQRQVAAAQQQIVSFQQQFAAAQSHTFALTSLAVTAGCLSAALLTMVLVRRRV